ncbi:family 78 glycoside hydrolase catalytic domain [Flavihumibacter stibioxidans]|uniref:alpha-L-rhamnosidase n=1 Tax=Flavihumibacter stibioxidans TaxID=1834163 RepID=A0ABR7M731_9BACT|nr:family 78 glycoside hydrolase catalytic domain [Flavihumibacter stibioxidans]MBC6490540.1 hypothetical protein [Flavihumibacter stibioxidans]
MTLILYCLLPFFAFSQATVLRVTDLRCENRRGPIGVDEQHPVLDWKLVTVDDFTRGKYQTAYRVQVASAKELLLNGQADIWDSHKQPWQPGRQVFYNGKVLRSGQTVWWRVKAWDEKDIPTGWSEPDSWSMGLLHPGDWKGRWIRDSGPQPQTDSAMYADNPAPVFRKEFTPVKKISKATLHVSGAGYYEAFINGARVGNRVLDPGQTDYSKRVLYSSYEVTELVGTDKNCIGIMLGNGWYNPLPLRMWGRFNLREALTTGTPSFLLQLDMVYADGSVESVVSDETWKVMDGPVTRNSVYLGEHHDNRKSLPGWNKTGFNDIGWRKVARAKAPGGILQSQFQPPVVIKDTLRPVWVKKQKDGRYLVDFGRNFGGVVRMLAKAPAGTKISVRYGELLYPDGFLNVMTSAAGQVKRKGMGGPGAPDTAYQADQFFCSGKGEEFFQPLFTYHGFRYAEISGYAGELKAEDISGLVMQADLPNAGEFTCSDTVINNIQQVCRNTFLSNVFSVQSDCPHREKFGYGGDIVGVHEAFLNNFDMQGFYAKTVLDFADAARSDGGLTETAPYVGIADAGLGNGSGPIEWGSVHPVLLYRMYQYYGDRRLLERQYPVAKNWIRYLQGKAKENIIDTTLGDHESIDPKDIAVSGTSFYYYNVLLLARMAGILGLAEDADYYNRLADRVKVSFVEKFVDTVSGKVGLGTQSTQAHALYFGLVPEKAIPAAVQWLVSQVANTHSEHIATGIFGTKYVPEVLSRYGYADLAYRLVTRRGFPGWVHMLENGATTLWEHWEYSDNTYSHNHPMFGVVSEWFYRWLAGIRPAEDAVGYDKIIIQPQFGSLSQASAGFLSKHGMVSSSWKKEGEKLTLDLEIPVNTTADIVLPVSSLASITENGQPLQESAGVVIVKNEGGFLHLRAGSGKYHFEW